MWVWKNRNHSDATPNQQTGTKTMRKCLNIYQRQLRILRSSTQKRGQPTNQPRSVLQRLLETSWRQTECCGLWARCFLLKEWTNANDSPTNHRNAGASYSYCSSSTSTQLHLKVLFLELPAEIRAQPQQSRTVAEASCCNWNSTSTMLNIKLQLRASCCASSSTTSSQATKMSSQSALTIECVCS